MNKWCVYVHIFPNKKRYVGITSRKPNDRWKNGEGYKRQYVYKAIQKYKWHNIDHKILYTDLSKEEAEQKEIELIKEFKSNNVKYGYNIDNGGMSCGQHSETTKKKMSFIASNRKGRLNPFYGKHHIKKTIETIKSKTGIKIKQYDLSGNFIKEWNSQNEIYNELHIDRKSVRLCCKGIYKQAGGYIWTEK